MQEFEIELTVGEPIQIGECVVRVLETGQNADTGNHEVEIEVESDGECELFTLQSFQDLLLETS